MIVKNEQTHLSKYLPEATAHCDEIIVVDTGSDDRTRSVAERHGVHLFDFEWQNDFSAARNFSLERATGEWILVLDADESVSGPDWALLRETAKNTAHDYFTLRTLNYVWQENAAGFVKNTIGFGDYSGYPGYIEGWVIRLFRNQSRFRFKGPIHEALTSEGAPLARNPLAVTIHNHGLALSEEKLIEKKKLYFQIGLKKVRENPFDVQANHEMGIACMELGLLPQAEHLLSNAFRQNPKHVRNLVALGCVKKDLKKYEEAEKYLLFALSRDPKAPAAHLALGLTYFNWGKADLAVEELQKELEQNPDSDQARSWLQKAAEALQRPR